MGNVKRLLTQFLVLSLVYEPIAIVRAQIPVPEGVSTGEFEISHEGKTTTVRINDRNAPSSPPTNGEESGVKVHEGQVCEILMQSGNERVKVQHECYQDSDDPGGGQDSNPHTKFYFKDAGGASSTKLKCVSIDYPSGYEKPCINHLDQTVLNSACYGHQECCSGYCEFEGSFATEQMLPGAVTRKVSVGEQGKCTDAPQGWTPMWPVAPGGLPSGSSCNDDAECQSKMCVQDGAGKVCESAKICKRCTKVGEVPLYGAPCCDSAIISPETNKCTVYDDLFQAADVADVLGIGGEAEDQLRSFITSSFLNSIRIKVPPAGNCSFQFFSGATNLGTSSNGEAIVDYDAANKGSSGGDGTSDGSEEEGGNRMPDELVTKMWEAIHIRDSFLAVQEFLQLYKIPGSDPPRPQDVFGMHKNLGAAMKISLQSRHDVHMIMKQFQDEMDTKLNELKQDPNRTGQIDVLKVAEDSYERMKEIAFIKSEALKKVALHLFGSAMPQTNAEGEPVSSGANYTYKKEKTMKSGGGLSREYDLLMWIQGRRLPGGKTQPGNCSVFVDDFQYVGEDRDPTCCHAWASIEEMYGESGDCHEAGENQESGDTNEGMIYVKSYTCDNDLEGNGNEGTREHIAESWMNEEARADDGEQEEENEAEHSEGWNDRFCVGSDVIFEAPNKQHTAFNEWGPGILVKNYRTVMTDINYNFDQNWLYGYKFSDNYGGIYDPEVRESVEMPHSLFNTYPAVVYNAAGQRNGAYAQNLRESMRRWMQNPVAHSFDISAEGGGSDFYGSPEGNILGYKGTGGEHSILGKVLETFLSMDHKMLDNVVYMMGSDNGVRFHNQRMPKQKYVLLLYYMTSDLAIFYDKVAKAYEQVKTCYQANNTETRERGSQGGTNHSGSVDEGNVAAEGGSANKAANAAGPQNSAQRFGNASGQYSGNVGGGAGIGIGAAGIGGDGARSATDDAFDAAFSEANQFVAMQKEKRKKFLKALGKHALGRRAAANNVAFAAPAMTGLKSAQQAVKLATASGLKSSSVKGIELDGAKPLTKEEAAKEKKEVDEAALKELKKGLGAGGIGIGGVNFGPGAGGVPISNNGKMGGTVDKHGLMNAVKKNPKPYESSKRDSIWDKISKRYMLSLERILILKKGKK